MEISKWFETQKIRYRGIELNGVLLVNIFTSQRNILRNLRNFLSTGIKNLRYSLDSEGIIYSKNFPNSLRTSMVFVVNFSPEDKRNFLHLEKLITDTLNPVVITMRKDVYNYFSSINIHTCLLRSQPNKKKQDDLIFEGLDPTSYSYYQKTLLLKAASLVALLEVLERESGLPKVVITLQDFYYFDAIFASFFKDKVPTVTLQHGMVNPGGLWQFVLSDYIICWGRKSAENLRKSGIPDDKIVPLGTAKYDQYLSSRIERDRQKSNFVIQIGIQQGSVLGEEYERKTYEFFREFIYSHPEYDYVLKFHPAKRKSEIKKYKRLPNVRNVRISTSNNAYELISESDVVLTYRTTLATDAMILDRPVIEYQLLTGDQTEGPFGDYRDGVIRISDNTSLERELEHLSSDKHYRDTIISKQREFLREEMLPPPNAKRIIDFLNSLSLRKE